MSTAFFRFVSNGGSEIISLDARGTVIWTNDILGATGRFQKADTVVTADWRDYVQQVADDPIMTARLFDFAPPDGMAFVPAGINAGDAPLPYGGYLLNVSEFHMDRAHVTLECWWRVRAWSITNGYNDISEGMSFGERHPVYHVSWFDAVKWCNARSEMEGRSACYRVDGHVYRTGERNDVVCDFQTAGYRLPTREEWEYAARGGLRNKLYPWGDDIDPSRLNYHGHVDSTTIAGSYPPNGFGLYDMAGNLSEWMWDWLPASGSLTNTYRTLKGGSWQDTEHYCRMANTGFNSPAFGAYVIGVRAVLTGQR